MHHLIKDGQEIDDPWTLIDTDTALPDTGPVILPLAYYREQRDEWRASDRPVGVWLNDAEFAEDVSEMLDDLALVALRFPKFADGRSFSKARLLRERYGFTGELRAFGDVLPDQVFYLRRCGVDSVACRSESEARTALRLLDTFSVRYQADTESRPLFDRR